ncbi:MULTISPECIES: hypothetical protein [unclassified Imperialibacter]|uniref:hypothetical protein n=1 Tax=unclassified Imperialibacter TaxID=2629706 RepID=UPI0012596886|nr:MULTISPECIES: hypothetical protein [unclassified Imperialibacter]CAD5251102.1 exported hypothetical protein [Imperialibacter sp. 89]CAD5284008.1 exported hypothetical protein [Imperialibacter sp. 75]VVT10821.1 exported hypothetical protein [Imperialibacter sp. EC-SDR9]
MKKSIISKVVAAILLLAIDFPDQAFCQDATIDNYFLAIGGRDAWAQVRSVQKKESGAYFRNSAWVDVVSNTYFQEPDLYCYVSRYASFNKGYVFDSKAGYELMLDKTIQKMPENEVESRKQRTMFASYPNLILEALEVKFLEERDHGGGKYLVYQITSKEGWEAEYYFDPKSYLLKFIRVAPTDNFICFYDYKEIDGLLWPTRIIGTEQIDNPVSERNLLEVKINEKIDPTSFSKKYLELLKIN